MGNNLDTGRIITSIVVAIFFFATAPAKTFATDYFIDFSAPNASDSNPGTSKSIPWKRAPGMKGWSGAYTHRQGDRFIFRGGVTWGADSLPLRPTGSGVYYGVDLTWFAPSCGAAFCRPVFDAQVTRTGFIYPEATGSNDLTIDNIEMKRLYWDTDVDFGTGNAPAYIWVGARTGIAIKNCYFHSWSHGPLAITGDDLQVVVGVCTPGGGRGNYIENCIFDGDPEGTNPTGRDSGAATYQFPVVRNSIARNMANGFLLGGDSTVPQEVSGSSIGPINTSFDKGKKNGLIDTSQHENAIEPVCSGPYVRVFNNIIHDIKGGVTLLMGSGSNYIYNNLIYNSEPIAIWLDERNRGSGYVYNNTVDATASSQGYSCIHAPAAPVFDVRNNLCISTVGGISGSPTANVANLTLSPAQAASQGINAANLYRLTAASNLAVDRGANLSSLGLPSISYDRVGTSRPQGSAWDIGAHERGASNAPPLPPSNLRAN